jgi:hypothetical protein
MSIKKMLLATTVTTSLVLAAVVPTTFAQETTGQQRCLNSLNRDGAAVAKQQGLENVGCVKSAAAGKLTGTAQACLTADAKGKVQK